MGPGRIVKISDELFLRENAENNDVMILEIPVFSADDAIVAAQHGASRLELCASYLEGGLTPGGGLLRYLKDKITIPVYVMIRPKAGYFFYSGHDIGVMKEEIRLLRDLGADGFVFGVLNRDRTVDTSACKDLIRAAGNLPCTFHRAFDQVPDVDEALKQLTDCGFARILTSGHPDNVNRGLQTLIRLIEKAGDEMVIMPGGGLRPEHLRDLWNPGILQEIHASCRSEHAERTDRADDFTSLDPRLIRRFRREIARLEQ